MAGSMTLTDLSDQFTKSKRSGHNSLNMLFDVVAEGVGLSSSSSLAVEPSESPAETDHTTAYEEMLLEGLTCKVRQPASPPSQRNGGEGNRYALSGPLRE
jgi:hypothetical protein